VTLRTLVTCLCLLGAPLAMRAQPPAAAPAPATAYAPGSELTVTLITFGEGPELFERFGHNALWFHDDLTGSDVAYHWGLFNFTEPGFIGRFLSGDTHYWMGPEDPRALVEQAQMIGRPVTLQRLDLTPAQRDSLRSFVRWNARDENKFYRYDYFRDNCSTRLRDALDHALGGALRRAADTAHSALTYRSESVRLTSGDRPIQAGIDIALGRPADEPITAWQSFFIPMRLRDALREVKVPGANGALVPVVADERVIPALPGRPQVQELATAPSLTGRYLLTGLLLAAIVVGLRIMMLTRRSAAWGLALFGAGWSLLCGVLGVLLLLAWLATQHVFWARNENVLLLTPLSLALVVLAPAALLRERGARAARMVSALVVLMASIALLLALVPGGQASGPIVALFFPVHLALAWALALPRNTRSEALA
jgi:hypothetical protein